MAVPRCPAWLPARSERVAHPGARSAARRLFPSSSRGQGFLVMSLYPLGEILGKRGLQKVFISAGKGRNLS